ncbi:MAG TPA: sulfite oxidase-like oxidoreductase [Oceanithermus profundus]|uniref:Sulfite oxidase-like oxidoreductase n=1 Tax=Oceanithermus profundus TaxID=187137 RepID=A0A7C4VG22_9DEIN|nr:sulfite oxidase-like oxidoreductase [Oceanithermus profundus]
MEPKLPPGQRPTRKFPLFTVDPSEPLERERFELAVTGWVERRVTLGWEDLRALAAEELEHDFHCVTGWTRSETRWSGVPVARVLELAGPKPEAGWALAWSRGGYSASLPLADLTAPGVLLAWELDGAPLTHDHGGPVRLVVPHLYGWKSVKWVKKIQLSDREVEGYWEMRGYHHRGDPWREERYG